MLIDRSILGPGLRFVDYDGRRYGLDDFKALIDRWRFFLRGKVRPKQKVALYADNSILTYALGFALWEEGLCFYGDNYKHRLMERALNRVKVDAFFVDRGNLADAESAVRGAVPLWRIPSVDEFLQWPSAEATGSADLRPEDEILIGFTSGTVGESKNVYHSHSSLLAASGHMSRTYYGAHDSVMLYLNLNHLGYVSCILLAAFRAGAEIHIVHKADPSMIRDKIIEGTTNVVPIFPYNWFTMIRDHPELSLDHVDRVVTGGDLISRDFASSVLRQGAKRILNVYGLTEVLPPVAVKSITLENLADHSGGNLGSPTPGHQIRFEEGEILVKGPNQGRVDAEGVVTPDGYTRTGDWGRMEGAELYLKERKKYLLHVGGREISASDLKFAIRTLSLRGRELMEHALEEGLDILIAEDRATLAIAAKDPSLKEDLTLDLVNEHLAAHFGPEVKIHQLLIEPDLPFNGIKLDRTEIRRRLQH